MLPAARAERLGSGDAALAKSPLGRGIRSSRLQRLRCEAGVGLVSSLAGIMVFLAFLLFAAQILVHLFATSYVNAAAFDAARLASGSGNVSAAEAQAHGANVLGMGDRATFAVDLGAEQVTVHVTARSPALLPRVFGRVFGTESIERSVTLRREKPVCGDC